MTVSHLGLVAPAEHARGVRDPAVIRARIRQGEADLGRAVTAVRLKALARSATATDRKAH